MAFFLSLFAQGVDGANIQVGLRVAGTAAGAMFLLLVTYATVRHLGSDAPTVEEDPIAVLRTVLSPSESRAIALDSSWMTSTHIRDSRGTPVVDLHDLPFEAGAPLSDELLASRGRLGRVRIVVGRNRPLAQGGVDPRLREMVIHRLRSKGPAVDWQTIIKPGSVTLRPMGKPPTLAIWMKRFLIGVVPIAGSFALSFRDLAGSTLAEQGFWFGLVAGLVVTALMASHRDRSG